MASKKEIEEVKADHAYWKELEKHLPWHVYGFTFRKHASFYTNQRRDVLTITSKQRDQILEAIERERGGK